MGMFSLILSIAGGLACPFWWSARRTIFLWTGSAKIGLFGQWLFFALCFVPLMLAANRSQLRIDFWAFCLALVAGATIREVRAGTSKFDIVLATGTVLLLFTLCAITWA